MQLYGFEKYLQENLLIPWFGNTYFKFRYSLTHGWIFIIYKNNREVYISEKGDNKSQVNSAIFYYAQQ